MRKTNLFFIILGLIGSVSLFGAISVTSPAAGTVWHKGDTVTISWTGTGCTDPNIKINIFRNSTAVENFVEQLTCTGCSSKSWTIPATYETGNYIIRVKTADNTCRGDSGVFAISPPPFVSTGSITVGSPGAGTEFLVTQWAINVNWVNTGSNHERVSLEAIPEGASSGTFIETDTPNDADYQWMNPGSLTGAGRFFIRIKTLDGNVYGDSAVFQVNELPAPAAIILVSGPESEAIWNVGSSRMIYWRNSGEMDDHVKIDIYNETGTTLVTPVYNNIPNDESEHWLVPAGHAAGRYILRVTTMDGLVSGDSGVFNITRPDDPVTDPRTPITEEESAPADPRTPVTPQKSITIKFPNRRTTWRTGQKAEIAWATGIPMQKKVKIELFQERRLGPGAVISPNTENDGKFIWKIPVMGASGKYLIKITTLDGNHYGTSGVFTINSKLPSIKK